MTGWTMVPRVYRFLKIYAIEIDSSKGSGRSQKHINISQKMHIIWQLRDDILKIILVLEKLAIPNQTIPINANMDNPRQKMLRFANCELTMIRNEENSYPLCSMEL